MAILVANSCRLLETIGWQHAEPVMRYVTAGLSGWPRNDADGPQNQPYPANLERVAKFADRLPGNWSGTAADEGLTRELVASVRTGKVDETCDLAVRRLADGKAQAGAVWDAVHLAAGELVLSSKPHNSHRPVNSAALHSNTAANALHYAFRSSGRTKTRLLLTIQALGWMHLFRASIASANQLPESVDLTRLEPADLPPTEQESIDRILPTRTNQPRDAARLALRFARRYRPQPLLQAARRLLPTKSSGDPHDIKFPVAIFEDLNLVGAAWRPQILAAAVYSFWGSDGPDHPLMQRVRDAVAKL